MVRWKNSFSRGALAVSLFAAAVPAVANERQAGTQSFHLIQLSLEQYDLESAKNFKAMTESIRSCDDARSVAQTFPAKMTENRNVRLSILPERLQDIVQALPVGQSTPVFSGQPNAPLRVLVVCGRVN